MVKPVLLSLDFLSQIKRNQFNFSYEILLKVGPVFVQDGSPSAAGWFSAIVFMVAVASLILILSITIYFICAKNQEFHTL